MREGAAGVPHFASLSSRKNALNVITTVHAFLCVSRTSARRSRHFCPRADAGSLAENGGERQTRGGKSLAAPFWSWSGCVKKQRERKERKKVPRNFRDTSATSEEKKAYCFYPLKTRRRKNRTTEGVISGEK